MSHCKTQINLRQEDTTQPVSTMKPSKMSTLPPRNKKSQGKPHSQVDAQAECEDAAAAPEACPRSIFHSTVAEISTLHEAMIDGWAGCSQLDSLGLARPPARTHLS